MALRTFGFVFIIFLALFIYRYNIAVPENFSEPAKLKFDLGMLRFVDDLSAVAGYLTGRRAWSIRDELASSILIQTVEEDSRLKVEDMLIGSVPVRLYTPVSYKKPGRGVIFYHGGGFTLSSIETYHFLLQAMAIELDVAMISVGYRLAPEHPYPAAADDCIAVTEEVLKNAEKYHMDNKRIALMGDSAGGNLAAVVSHQFRLQTVKPKLQVLLFPIMQGIDLETPSYQEFGESHLVIGLQDSITCLQYYLLGGEFGDIEEAMKNKRYISKATGKKYAKSYLNHDILPNTFFGSSYKKPVFYEADDSELRVKFENRLSQPHASPLLADDLTGVPKTFIYTSYNDILRDDSMFYAARLRDHDIAVEQFIHQTGFHGVWFYFNVFVEGKECYDSVNNFLRDNL